MSVTRNSDWPASLFCHRVLWLLLLMQLLDFVSSASSPSLPATHTPGNSLHIHRLSSLICFVAGLAVPSVLIAPGVLICHMYNCFVRPRHRQRISATHRYFPPIFQNPSSYLITCMYSYCKRSSRINESPRFDSGSTILIIIRL